jgi:hypothetical protein
MKRAMLLAVVAGCGAIEHDIHDVKRKHEAEKWAGTYTFLECAATNGPPGATPACWRYVIVIDSGANGLVTVEGPEPPPRMKVTARSHRPDRLDLKFDSYPDEGVDIADVGLHVFDGARGRYTPGQYLAFVTRDASGRLCLTFDGMSSKLGSKTLCSN